MIRGIIVSVILIFIGSGCSQKAIFPAEEPTRGEPDYSNLSFWAAHPEKVDPADRKPGKRAGYSSSEGEVDVFFVHPTTYTGKRNGGEWNARFSDMSINERTDKTTILYQASIFNKVGPVYAPRYRQAHIGSFYSTDKTKSRAALDLAYRDVRAAFLNYLSSGNHGRPIIIAAHSQGTVHAKRLLDEFFEGKELGKQLVVAYLVGMPVEKEYFEFINPCSTPAEVGCFCSWRTFKRNVVPSDSYPMGDHIAVTNPISWTTSDDYVEKSLSKGAVLRNFNKVFKGIIDAQVYNGILWVSKPKFPWSFLFTRKNYHIADMNFFYLDISENAALRSQSYLMP